MNLKYVDGENFIFSNYNSPKSLEFQSHSQIAASLFWPKINCQIRMKAYIKRTDKSFNDKYFSERDIKKNALAISSNQSKRIKNYERVIENYENILKSGNLLECPDYWGGFEFSPYEIEFWMGQDYRLNKRDLYKLSYSRWTHSI